VDFDLELNIVNKLEHSTSGVVSSVVPNLKIINNLKKTTYSVFYYASPSLYNTHTRIVWLRYILVIGLQFV
jgi:hypothetical protein